MWHASNTYMHLHDIFLTIFLLVLRSTYTQQKSQDENIVGRYEMLETYVKKWFLSGFFSSVQICSPWGIFFWDWGRFSKDSRLVHNVPFRRQHEILWRYFECTCLPKWRKNFGNETLQKNAKNAVWLVRNFCVNLSQAD